MPAAPRRTPGPERYAVLGSPVSHSLSPAMQRAAFTAAGIDASYEAIEVPADALEATLADLHRDGFAGLNLTAPLKERARPLLVGATEEAERAGSVNTLRRAEGGWLGDTTDGGGFFAWAREIAAPFDGARIALLGAGGAARAVAPYLARLGARSVAVVARDAGRAASVADAARGTGTRWRACALGADAPGDAVTILVRALAVGEIVPMEAPWWRAVDSEGLVVDLNYGPLAAATRALAARSGTRFEDGTGMLLHQGALAFERWTGRPAPLEAMRRALAAAL